MYGVKCENGNGVCRACLSSDRRLSPLTNYDLYFTLLNKKEKPTYKPVVLVCWECASVMRRMHAFQLQALKANKILAETLEISLTNGSFSQLSICHKQDYDAIFEESSDTLAEKPVYDTDIKEEKSDDVEFDNLQLNDIKDYNSETYEGAFEDDHFETKEDVSSDEESMVNIEKTTNKHVTDKKRKQEFDKVEFVAARSSRIEFESLSSNQLSKRRSTRIKVMNSFKPTLKRFKADKNISQTNDSKQLEKVWASGDIIKHKDNSKKRKTEIASTNYKAQPKPKTKKNKIDKDVSETNVSKNLEIEFVTDHIIEDSDQFKTGNDSDFNKSDKNKDFKENSTNYSSERKIDIIENIVIQDVSDDLDDNDRKDRKLSNKSEVSDSEDNDPDYPSIEMPKEEKKRTRKYKEQRLKKKMLQTVIVKYTCNDLDDYFNKVEISDDMIKDVLKSEPKYVTEERPYGCEYCGFCFQYTRQLTHHKRTRHKQVRKAMKCTDPTSPNYYRYSMYSCSVCDRIIRKEHADAHIKYLHRVKYVCTECDGVFWDKEVGEAHCKNDHTQFVCKICNVVKKQRKYLDKHMQTWHIPCTCEDCGQEFPRKSALRNHRDTKHPDSNPELRYCVQCNIQYRSIFAYQAHLRYTKTHKVEPGESFPCPVCGKVLMTKFAMECHYDRFHQETTRFQCPHCGKFFARKNGLQNHIANAHLKVAKTKDKICSYCGRAFNTNRILIHHIRTHTGERPHACPHCPAAFAQPFPLTKHIATVHRNITCAAQNNTDLSSQGSVVPSDNDKNSAT